MEVVCTNQLKGVAKPTLIFQKNMDTLPKFKSKTPEKSYKGPQKETSFPTINSSGAMLNFRGVKMVFFCSCF